MTSAMPSFSEMSLMNIHILCISTSAMRQLACTPGLVEVLIPIFSKDSSRVVTRLRVETGQSKGQVWDHSN